MTESSKFTRREVIAGVTMALLPPVAGAAEVPPLNATLESEDMIVTLQVNNHVHRLPLDPRATLLDTLREALQCSAQGPSWRIRARTRRRRPGRFAVALTRRWRHPTQWC